MAASTYEPLKARSDLNNLRVGRPSDSSIAASPLAAIGYYLTLLFIVLLVGRVAEITTWLLGSSFYQILILDVVLLALVVITGALVKVGSNRLGTIWIAFHLWLAFTLPFSGYRRGSVEIMMSILVFLPGIIFIGGFLDRSTETLRRGVWALAWAGIIGLGVIQQSGIQMDEDRLVSTGSFGNSNLLAIYLLVMIPVWAFISMNSRYSWLTRLLFVVAICMALANILKTGSRSGFLSIAILALILFVSASLANKAKLLVVGGFAVFLAAGIMSDGLKSRIGTLFHSDAKDYIAEEARGSADARMELLKDSVEMTLKHPLFGSGLGVFSAVAAGEKEARGEHASWQATHNMYTQVSSEVGFPGVTLFIMGLLWNVKALWAVRKAGQMYPALRETGAIAGALLCSWIVVLFNGAFTSMAYDYTVYVLTGLTIATSVVCQESLRHHAENLRFGTNTEPVRSARFFPVKAPAAAPVQEVVTVPASETEVIVAKNLDAPWRKNPRKYPPKPGAPSR